MSEEFKIVEAKINAVENDIKTLKENIVEIFTRLNAAEKINGIVNEKLENIKESQKDIKKTIENLTLKVESIMQAPAQRWNTVQTAIITGIISIAITSVVAFLLRK